MNKLSFFILSTILIFISCNDKIAKPSDISLQTNIDSNTSIYQFEVKDIDENDVSLAEYKDKVILIVNTASKCGLTPQYKELEELYQKYKDKGLVILGFPANNFLSQEPGSNLEIKQFCEANYGVSFPMFAKISVKGNDIHPLYQYLTQKSENGTLDAPVKWNFQKFLIDKNGVLVASYSPKTSVTDEEFLESLNHLF